MGLLGVFVLIQFIQPDRSVVATAPSQDLCAALQPPASVAELLKAACYDCHSYETRYPWYSRIAPVSWWITNHISEGREQINFNTFGAVSPRDRVEVLKECSEEVLDGHMPLRSYTWMHAKARLSAEQRRALADWFSARARYSGAKGEE